MEGSAVNSPLLASVCEFKHHTRTSRASAPDAAFWFALSERKLKHYQLDESARPIRAYFLPGECCC